MTDAEHEDDNPFTRIDGKLYYRDHNGELIGPLDPAAPTCGDNTDGE